MLCLVLYCCVFLFFFKQKTAYEMRISDWSSDVCSSDLLDAVNLLAAQVAAGMIDAGIGGGVESMSRTVMGYDSGAWTSDPQIAFANHYAPQGIGADRSEEHTSELQSLMRISYAVFCLKKKKKHISTTHTTTTL